MAVPKLRFPGFTDDWEQRKLGDISSLITKGTTPKDKSGNGEVNFIKVENIDDSSGMINGMSKISLEEHNGYLKRSQLNENDILFSIAGTLGRVTIVNKAVLPANTNQALAIIRLKEGNLQYVKTCLKGNVVTDFIKKNPTVGAQPNLSLEQVSSLEIAIPSTEEQQLIGVYFSNLNNLITLHQRIYDELQDLKKSLLQKMFPKDGEVVPEIRFPGFDEEWEEYTIKDIFDLQYGQFNNNPDNGGIYPIYGANGIIGGYTEYNAENSIVIGHIGTAGTVMYEKNKHFVTYNGTITKIKKDLDYDIVFCYFALLKLNIPRICNGSSQPFLSYDKLNKMKMLLPSSKEQQKIGSFFKELDNRIELQKQKIDEIKEYKKGLLQQMFC